MERVSIIEGHRPILVLAPHGCNTDDENTALMVEYIAGVTDGFAVINRGWQRSDKVDFINDRADCNNINHCNEDVVKDEFLDPIVRYKNRILKRYNRCYTYLIHGMGNHHRGLCGDSTLDIVFGCGLGSPNSLSCDEWVKNAFFELLGGKSGMTIYQGKKGGAMSGWARQNMNQLFRKHLPDPRVQSMQIEIIYDLRKTPEIAEETAESLAMAMIDLLSVSEKTVARISIPEY